MKDAKVCMVYRGDLQKENHWLPLTELTLYSFQEDVINRIKKSDITIFIDGGNPTIIWSRYGDVRQIKLLQRQTAPVHFLLKYS